MAMNFGINQNQQFNQEASAAAVSQEINKAVVKEKEVKEKPKPKEQSLVSQLLDGDDKAKKKLMFSSAKGANKGAKKKDGKLDKKLERELQNMFKSEAQSPKDSVKLSHLAAKFKREDDQKPKEKEKPQKFSILGMGKEAKGLDVPEPVKQAVAKEASKKSEQAKRAKSRGSTSSLSNQKELVQSFASALSSYVSSKDPSQKQRMDAIKKELQREGVSQSQINTMESSVGKALKQNYVAQMKSNLLKHFFTKVKDDDKFSKLDDYATQLTYYETAAELKEAQKQGLLKSPISDVMESLRKEIRQEFEGFMFDEAAESFSRTALGQSGLDDFTKELQQLQKLAQNVGVEVNEQELSSRIKRSIDDLGLEEFVPPDTGRNVDTGDGSGHPGQGQQQQQEDTSYVSLEEQLEDQLRSLYMMRALTGSFQKKMDISFKMRKLKNGLIKLGVVVGDMDKRLESEGVFLAQMKLLGKLKDTFREQATLEKLSGPVYQIIKKRRAVIVKHLRKTGYKLNKEKLTKYRDDANAEIYPMLKEQMKQAEMMLEVRQSAGNSRKYQFLLGVLERLRSETKIMDSELDGERIELSQRVVSEAA